MSNLSLTQKRIAAGIYLALLLLCAASFYLSWGLFEPYDRKVLAVVTFAGVVVAARYGSGLVDEIREYRAAQEAKRQK